MSKHEARLSTGAMVGVGVGVGLATLSHVGPAAWIMWRRKSNPKSSAEVSVSSGRFGDGVIGEQKDIGLQPPHFAVSELSPESRLAELPGN